MPATKYSFSEILSVMDRKHYAYYTKGLFNLNLVGVRTENSISDKFDDLLYVFYRGEDNQFKLHEFAFTSDAGKHWLLNPMNVGGCAILVPGQYRNVYLIGGRHKDYEALEQVAPMQYVRDSNRDNNLDFNLYRDPILRKKHIFNGIIKSNMHRASAIKTLLNVGMYSAACQVLQKPEDFKFLIELSHKNKANGNGSRLSYTLLEELDFK